MTQLLRTYQRDLALRGFAERTCEHYTANVRQFLKILCRIRLVIDKCFGYF